MNTIDIHEDLTDDTQLPVPAGGQLLLYLVRCDHRMREDYILPIDLPKELLCLVREYVINTDQVIYVLKTKAVCTRGSLTGHLIVNSGIHGNCIESGLWYDHGFLANFPKQ
jgi:hypothetical protein